MMSFGRVSPRTRIWPRKPVEGGVQDDRLAPPALPPQNVERHFRHHPDQRQSDGGLDLFGQAEAAAQPLDDAGEADARAPPTTRRRPPAGATAAAPRASVAESHSTPGTHRAPGSRRRSQAAPPGSGSFRRCCAWPGPGFQRLQAQPCGVLHCHRGVRNCSIRCCSAVSCARAAFTSSTMLLATSDIWCCTRACRLGELRAGGEQFRIAGTLRRGKLRLPPGGGGDRGLQRRHHGGREHLRQGARRLLPVQRRLRLLQLSFLEQPVARDLRKLLADGVELLMVDGLRPAGIRAAAVRRFLAKSVLQAVLLDRHVLGLHLAGRAPRPGPAASHGHAASRRISREF